MSSPSPDLWESASAAGKEALTAAMETEEIEDEGDAIAARLGRRASVNPEDNLRLLRHAPHTPSPLAQQNNKPIDYVAKWAHRRSRSSTPLDNYNPPVPSRLRSVDDDSSELEYIAAQVKTESPRDIIARAREKDQSLTERTSQILNEILERESDDRDANKENIDPLAATVMESPEGDIWKPHRARDVAPVRRRIQRVTSPPPFENEAADAQSSLIGDYANAITEATMSDRQSRLSTRPQNNASTVPSLERGMYDDADELDWVDAEEFGGASQQDERAPRDVGYHTRSDGVQNQNDENKADADHTAYDTFTTRNHSASARTERSSSILLSPKRRSSKLGTNRPSVKRVNLESPPSASQPIPENSETETQTSPAAEPVDFPTETPVFGPEPATAQETLTMMPAKSTVEDIPGSPVSTGSSSPLRPIAQFPSPTPIRNLTISIHLGPSTTPIPPRRARPTIPPLTSLAMSYIISSCTFVPLATFAFRHAGDDTVGELVHEVKRGFWTGMFACFVIWLLQGKLSDACVKSAALAAGWFVAIPLWAFLGAAWRWAVGDI